MNIILPHIPIQRFVAAGGSYRIRIVGDLVVGPILIDGFVIELLYFDSSRVVLIIHA
ncbi:hypothetical protein D3C85_1501230 [compost metagenome]